MGIRISFYILGVAIIGAFSWIAYNETNREQGNENLARMAKISSGLDDLQKLKTTVNTLMFNTLLSEAPGVET